MLTCEMVKGSSDYFGVDKLKIGNYYYNNNFNGAHYGLYRENSSNNKS